MTKTNVAKPYPDFPLTPHSRGKWCKKVKGKIHYFGDVDDWETALAKYERQAPYLHAGKPVPISKDTDITVKQLCQGFLQAKLDLVESGELPERSYDEYKTTAKKVADCFGRTATSST